MTTNSPIAKKLPSLIIGNIVAGRYLIHQKIGSGAMGAVYEAEHVHLRTRVALKILHEEFLGNSEAQARFEREAIAAAKVQHPTIAEAIDFGVLENGARYLALEFVSGVTLRELLDQEGSFAIQRVLMIAFQVSAALAAAHGKNVIHRDLKPENIMLVTLDSGDELVKVLDFGIAKVCEAELPESQKGLTKAGSLFGTPEYMAPEQVCGEAVDSRADLYALGIIIYEMLAGHSPFAAEELVDVLSAQITQEPPELELELPEPFRVLIRSLLAKKIEDRPSSADELYCQLEEISRALGFTLSAPRTLGGSQIQIAPGTARSGETIPVSGEVRIELSNEEEEEDEPLEPLRPSMIDMMRDASRRSIVVGQKKIPLGVLVLVMVVGAVLGTVLTIAVRRHFEAEATLQAEVAAEAAHQQLLERVRSGDRESITELRARADLSYDASTLHPDHQSALAADYLALGRGYASLSLYPGAVLSYSRALELDPHSAEDGDLLWDIHQALARRDTVDAALQLTLKHLGSLGADLIYDVWDDHRGQRGMTAVVARMQKLVHSEELHELATDPLKVALELERGENCEKTKALLPRAIAHGDERSLRRLEALRVTSGCRQGQQKVDCFACLRSEDEKLEQALARARAEKQPPLFRAPAQGAAGTAAPSKLRE
ncbi:MAG: serine/threonine protein kinase [Polyangiaceae bacterium]|nr:serine/threonine protein kinase [Polyangiaceae bacterium]